MASRSLSDVHFNLLPLFQQFQKDLQREGIEFIVTCTYRSNKEQNTLYAQGRTTPGKIVTNARGGQSEHNFTVNGVPASKAIDIVPMFLGKCDWDETSERWQKIGEVWARGYHHNGYYLDWYGRKDSPFHEMPHFCLKEDK